MNANNSNILLDKVLKLSKKIINCYPIYTRPDAQKAVQHIIKRELELEGWETYLDTYNIEDIKNKNILRYPGEYDNFYRDYTNILKTNLYGVWDSGKPGPTLIVNGHIDVDIINKEVLTPPSHNAYIKENRLYGRGSTDMLVGLCCLVYSMHFFQQKLNNGKVIFVSVVDEEIGGNGALRACEWLADKWGEETLKNTEVVIAEPTENRICTSTLGFLPFVFTNYSNTLHMNANKKDELKNLIDILNKLQKFKQNHNSLNLNVGYISGGSDPSLPISRLIFKGVISTHQEYKIDYLIHTFNELLHPLNIVYPKMLLEATDVKNTKFGQKYYSIDKALFESACDASVFYHFGMKPIIFGPGSLKQAHTQNEYIEINDIKIYIKKLRDCLTNFFK